ncbi:hypothetical protein CALVIDRAFT_529292 [Calocera viscosa TUFC12733]|uniref:Uncharacterized protein n=1 Tax=Calocera viscosa (strain TUFC12733) TaxID=1330018 RepID=A0A167JR08_CALVF|nr:hypothetical protein CALVIDRAFT_529292 [Calocera viscosa TUFC12733]
MWKRERLTHKAIQTAKSNKPIQHIASCESYDMNMQSGFEHLSRAASMETGVDMMVLPGRSRRAACTTNQTLMPLLGVTNVSSNEQSTIQRNGQTDSDSSWIKRVDHPVSGCCLLSRCAAGWIAKEETSCEHPKRLRARCSTWAEQTAISRRIHKREDHPAYEHGESARRTRRGALSAEPRVVKKKDSGLEQGDDKDIVARGREPLNRRATSGTIQRANHIMREACMVLHAGSRTLTSVEPMRADILACRLRDDVDSQGEKRQLTRGLEQGVAEVRRERGEHTLEQEEASTYPSPKGERSAPGEDELALRRMLPDLGGGAEQRALTTATCTGGALMQVPDRHAAADRLQAC